MLRSVSVRNYKAIGPNELTLDLAPITILVGGNGTGKSSILEAVALTAQSAIEEPSRSELVLSGSLIQIPHEIRKGVAEIGSIYYQKDIHRPLAVRLNAAIDPASLKVAGRGALVELLGEAASGPGAEVGYQWSRTGEDHPDWEHLYSIGRKPLVAFGERSEKTSTTSISIHEYFTPHWISIEPMGLWVRAHLDRVLPPGLFTGLDLSRLQPMDEKLQSELETLKLIGENVLVVPLREMFGRIAFLSALRGRQIMHRDTGPEVRFAGEHGEMTVRLLSNIEARKDERIESLRHWAEEFGLSGLEAGWAGDQQLKVTFRDPPTDTRLALDAAASGSVNGLMLAAQLLLSPPGACLLIEEPEISMNPGFEKKLPGLFADSVRRGHQVIAATHSEVLVAAMGNAVRLGINDLSASDVAIYELSREAESGVSARRLDISDRGNLDSWVTSFSRVEQELFDEWAESLPEVRDEPDPGYSPAGGRGQRKGAARKSGRGTRKKR